MNRERIQTTIDHLRSIPKDVAEEHFQMYTWRCGRIAYSYKTVPWACGTAGCAGGWMPYIPAFREAGLMVGRYGEPKFNGKTKSFALAEFLDISLNASTNIFERWERHDGYAALDEVCNKLQRLLDNGGEL